VKPIQQEAQMDPTQKDIEFDIFSSASLLGITKTVATLSCLEGIQEGMNVAKKAYSW
jgi:hypothetical protein